MSSTDELQFSKELALQMWQVIDDLGAKEGWAIQNTGKGPIVTQNEKEYGTLVDGAKEVINRLNVEGDASALRKIASQQMQLMLPKLPDRDDVKSKGKKGKKGGNKGKDGKAKQTKGSETDKAASEGMSSNAQVAQAAEEAASEVVANFIERVNPNELSLDEKVGLALSVAEECIQPEELRNLLANKPNPIAYDGFEPSGRVHIAQGILKAINVNKLTSVGCTFVFWVADWFALMNNKMGGDLKKIRTVGEYMIEVWTACGMDMNNVKFVWSSDDITDHASEYWLRVLNIARANNLARVKRCSQIMGRAESDDLSASQIFYPCMQAADIFHLKADICQLGMDQRKVNMLAREYCDVIKRKNKPIILSHHMLMGLKEGQAKMSKSDPDSAIFMEDTAKEVERKMNSAFCPAGVVEDNPVLDYMKHIVFNSFVEVEVKRSEEEGGDKTYTHYEDLEADFVNEAVHPKVLKACAATYVNLLLEPVRKHFTEDEHAKGLLAKVKTYQQQMLKLKQKQKGSSSSSNSNSEAKSE